MSDRQQATMTADEAWAQYCRTGVIAPRHAGVIAERRQRQREWAAAGEALR